MKNFLLSGDLSQLNGDDGLDAGKVGAPFRVSVYNPDLETLSIETAPDQTLSTATWEVLGTVNSEVGSVIVSAPVPRLRVVSDGPGTNVFVQIIGLEAAPI